MGIYIFSVQVSGETLPVVSLSFVVVIDMPENQLYSIMNRQFDQYAQGVVVIPERSLKILVLW